ncbi:glycoside hydrolase family 2 TIM barrel-domain containing protein [Haloferula sp.]|uniref:glycoside hydrolase family 2 TIM barrel-domain containing protein n=1 Tax=Haloferula sp. TaxID=2497595 RepID=UPI003C750814
MNELAVRLQPEDLSSRWYPGAGLYRNTWMVLRSETRVPLWGSFVTTPKVGDALAEVRVENQIRPGGATQVKVTVAVDVLDPSGKKVAESQSSVALNPGETITQSQSVEVSNPQRWDITKPVRYTAVTRILNGDQEVDRYEVPFGIRTVDYVAGKGPFLNGKHVRINGVCMHHDLGALGAAVNYRATERQMEIMQLMGVNSIRTSHNPPSPELLEICGKIGLMVQVEAFDCWQIAKVEKGYNKFRTEGRLEARAPPAPDLQGRGPNTPDFGRI